MLYISRIVKNLVDYTIHISRTAILPDPNAIAMVRAWVLLVPLVIMVVMVVENLAVYLYWDVAFQIESYNPDIPVNPNPLSHHKNCIFFRHY